MVVYCLTSHCVCKRTAFPMPICLPSASSWSRFSACLRTACLQKTFQHRLLAVHNFVMSVLGGFAHDACEADKMRPVSTVMH